MSESPRYQVIPAIEGRKVVKLSMIQNTETGRIVKDESGLPGVVSERSAIELCKMLNSENG